MSKRANIIMASAGALSMIGGTTALAATPQAKVVSTSNPYSTCTVGGPGTNYLNAEVEPYVAVNPANSSNLIGQWQQDRWSNGGAHGLASASTTNGGKNWAVTPLPFSVCAPGGLNYERASDPWVSIGPDGTAYSVSISFNQSNNDNAVAAATSTDSGATWGNLSVLKADTGTTQYFNDKESVTADPGHAGVAYAVWDRLASPNSNPYADGHAFAYTGPTWFSKTINGGKNWSPAYIINDVANPTGEMNQTIGNQIVVDPNSGTLYDFFDAIYSTGSNSTSAHYYNVAMQSSTDGGATWTSPQVISPIHYAPVSDPNTGATIRTGDIIPEPAIDASGNLYVVWQDSRFSGGAYSEVAASVSTRGGLTWSTPARVNTPTGRPAFTPMVAAAAGTVALTYYDFRKLGTQTTTLPTDYWKSTATSGSVNFGSEQHVAGSFDMLTAPYAHGYFVGDYEGLASVSGGFDPFFVQTTGTPGNPTDVYFAG